MRILHLPRLGQTMREGTITEWRIAPGDSFDVGDVIYELETEKNVVEIEAKMAGRLYRIVVDDDLAHATGEAIAVIEEHGEELDDATVDAALMQGARAGGVTPSKDGGAAAPNFATSGDTVRPTIRIVPRARKRAKELDVDISTIMGTGRGGTITVQDVESQSHTGRDSNAVVDRRALGGVARAMADSVTRSWREIPQFVQQITVDASRLKSMRDAERKGDRPTYTALIIAAVATALSEVPDINAVYRDGDIVRYQQRNVGVAVSTNRGLVVPVLSNIDPADVRAISEALKSAVERATTGRPEAGGSPQPAAITVSNLGAYGVETGVPLIPEGQTALVFVGATIERPAVAADGRIVAQPQLGLAIAYDHRVVDGARAAAFTAVLRRALEGVE